MVSSILEGSTPDLTSYQQQAKAGDDDAIKSLLSFFAPEILAMIRGSNIHRNDQEDTVQECLIELMKCIDSYDSSKGNFVHYVRKACYRKVIWVRRGMKPSMNSLDGYDSSLDWSFNNRWEAEELLSTLPSEQRELVEGYFGINRKENATINQLAAMTNQQPKIVKKQLEEALMQLRRSG